MWRAASRTACYIRCGIKDFQPTDSPSIGRGVVVWILVRRTYHRLLYPAHRRGHKTMMLSDVCLTWRLTSVAYIGHKSRTKRPRKTKIGTEVSHVTRDSGTTFNVKRSKVKVTLTGHRRVNASGSCSGERGNVLAVETTATLRSARRFGAHGRGISWRPPAYSLLILSLIQG